MRCGMRAFQEWQRCQLRAIVEMVARCEMQIDFVIFAISWDETQQRLAMPVSSTSTPSQRSSSWETMVVKFRVSFGWMGQGLRRPLCLPTAAYVAQWLEARLQRNHDSPLDRSHSYVRRGADGTVVP